MEPGTVLGPYRIDRELGSGGMGTVYSAVVAGRCPGLDEGDRVALKVVHPHLLATPMFLERFEREGEIGKRVRHPNVVRTFDSGGIDGWHYLAMEYVEGETLDALRQELDRVPEELCRHIGREVCRGLGAIHAAGAVHRDIKPENVLITPDHVVKIMDLGVALATDDALRLSQTGAFVGSLHYAAPEQFTGGGKDLDGRVDLHALGLVLYELASAESPYYAEELPQVLQRVLHQEPRRLGELNPQLSPFFEEVVHCLLAKDRDARFGAADELLAVLEAGEESPWWHARAAALQIETARPIRRVRIPRETSVYGRETELAALRALYERAKSGDGNVVLVEGEAGIGKSRLVDELIGQLQRDGERIDFLYGSYPPGGAATAAGAFSTAYREQFGAAGSAPYLPENQILVPAFDALLRGDTTPADAEPLTKGSLQTCFVRATQTLATERVVIVLIDDLHFAPEEGRALFSALALGVPGHRVLLVGTARPGVPEQWRAGLTRMEQTSQLAVQRIGPKDLMELLRDTLKSDRLADALAGQISTKSDGNPFFVFEIIRGLREGQFITQQDDGTWVSTRVIEDIQIPSSVLDLIRARIADLSEEETELLDVAACCGFEFDPGLVAESVGMRRIPALRAFGNIEKCHRLVRSAGRNYVFDHHQVQEVLYAALHEQIREEYHAALAETLETRAGAAERDPGALPGSLCVTLCQHYLAGGRGASALRYLPAAQEHLAEGYLHAEVVTLGERALAVPGLLEGVPRAQVQLRLANALNRLGRRDRQEACAREAERLAEEARDEELRGKAARALGWCLIQVSRHEEAEAALRRALQIARSRGDRSEDGAVTGHLGMVLESQGRHAEAKEHFARHLELAGEAGDRLGEAAASAHLGHVLRLEGRLAEARAHYERSLAIAKEIGARGVEARATSFLGMVLAGHGRLAEAKEHYERALALVRETGDRPGEAVAWGFLGTAAGREGRFDASREHIERFLALARETGDRGNEAIALVNLGSTWHSLGDPTRARGTLEDAVAQCREIGARYALASALLDLGRVADEEDRAADAAPLLEESLALARESGDVVGLADSLVALGELRRRTGDVDAARAALDEAASLTRAPECAPQVALALALRACLPDGDAAAAETALADAGAAGESPTVRWFLYQATGDRAHLEVAKRLLDEALAKVPVHYHDAMRTNVRVHREIVAAWRDNGGADIGD